MVTDKLQFYLLSRGLFSLSPHSQFHVVRPTKQGPSNIWDSIKGTTPQVIERGPCLSNVSGTMSFLRKNKTSYLNRYISVHGMFRSDQSLRGGLPAKQWKSLLLNLTDPWWMMTLILTNTLIRKDAPMLMVTTMTIHGFQEVPPLPPSSESTDCLAHTMLIRTWFHGCQDWRILISLSVAKQKIRILKSKKPRMLAPNVQRRACSRVARMSLTVSCHGLQMQKALELGLGDPVRMLHTVVVPFPLSALVMTPLEFHLDSLPDHSCQSIWRSEGKLIDITNKLDEPASHAEQSSEALEKSKCNGEEPIFWPFDQNWNSEESWTYFSMSPLKDRPKLGTAEGNFTPSIGLNHRGRSLSRLEEEGSMKASAKVVPLDSDSRIIKQGNIDTRTAKLKLVSSNGNFWGDGYSPSIDLSIETVVGLEEFDGHEGIDSCIFL